jgi:hypothetical protein
MTISAHVPVVLHYHGGTTESVFAASDVAPGATAVRVLRSSGEETAVPLSTLKAIFFIRTAPLADGEIPADGKLLAVEFRDGEVIRGMSEEHIPSLSGFLLYPLDRSKNDRIFVVNEAVVSIDVEKF